MNGMIDQIINLDNDRCLITYKDINTSGGQSGHQYSNSKKTANGHRLVYILDTI